jgi:hypothetical protein
VRERLTAQLLAGPPARTPLAVAQRLLAVQGQDLRGARLAVRARSRGLNVADVDRALTNERSLLITWLNRGTLHLVASDDYPWLQALTTPPLATAIARRLAQEGVTPAAADRGVAAIERALADEGPLTRDQLRDRVAAARVPTKGQALVFVLFLASLRGLVVRGPIVGKQHAYALVRDWLGASQPVHRDRALAELARRYLAGHGPATERDLAYWVGLPLRDARVGLVGIAGELAVLDDGLVDLAAAPEAARRTGARLLPVFDPYLLGWKERAFEVDAQHVPKVYAGGLIGPAAAVDGRLVGTWRAVRRGDRLALDVEPFEPLSLRADAALRREREDLARFEGVELAEAP